MCYSSLFYDSCLTMMTKNVLFFLVLLCDSPENVLQRTYEAAEKVENKSNTLHHNVTTGMCYFAKSTYGFSSVGLSVCLFVDNITQKVMNLLDK